uniref:Uncharacterized protein n=1 Tax=Romanomermis culicivorax TaxID=13658 RepID=A0A915K5S5_ROMCU
LRKLGQEIGGVGTVAELGRWRGWDGGGVGTRKWRSWDGGSVGTVPQFTINMLNRRNEAERSLQCRAKNGPPESP